MNDEVINILFLGAIGSGKTSTINNLIQNSNNSGFSNIKIDLSKTESVKDYTIFLRDKKIRLIDTPGIGHLEGPEEDNKILSNIFENVYSKYKKIHEICIVFNIQHKWLMYYISTFLRVLHKNAAKNIVFIGTHFYSSSYDVDRFNNNIDYIFDNINKQKILIDRRKSMYFIDNKSILDYKYGTTFFGNNLLLENLLYFCSGIKAHEFEETFALNEAQKFYVFIQENNGISEETTKFAFANILSTHSIFTFNDADGVVDDYLEGKSDEIEDIALKRKYHDQRSNNFEKLFYLGIYFPAATEHDTSEYGLYETLSDIKIINAGLVKAKKDIFNIKLLEKIFTMESYVLPENIPTTQSAKIQMDDMISKLIMEKIITPRTEKVEKSKDETKLKPSNSKGQRKPYYGRCQYCGENKVHKFKKCFARKEICTFCQKVGHIKNACTLSNISSDKVIKETDGTKNEEEQKEENSISKDSNKEIANITAKTENLKISKGDKNQQKTSSTTSNAKIGNSKKCCYFCGSDKYHTFATCFAKKEICKICNKKGHIEEACHQKLKTNIK